MMRAYSLGLALAVIGSATAAARAGDSDLEFTDRFGRTINNVGLVLVDWEGYLANPALEFFLHPPAAATLPASVSITGNGVRLYLDAPSVVGAAGPSKVVGSPRHRPER